MWSMMMTHVTDILSSSAGWELGPRPCCGFQDDGLLLSCFTVQGLPLKGCMQLGFIELLPSRASEYICPEQKQHALARRPGLIMGAC